MSWNVPNETEMDTIEQSQSVFIPDLTAGHFKGMIEQVDIDTDEHGKEIQDKFLLAIRVAETGNHEHVGKLMRYMHYMKDKKGKFIPANYRFLATLDPSIKAGGSWHPTKLMLIEFEATISYSGKYWNFTDPVFIEKHKDFGF